jgi:hypothetical protein
MEPRLDELIRHWCPPGEFQTEEAREVPKLVGVCFRAKAGVKSYRGVLLLWNSRKATCSGYKIWSGANNYFASANKKGCER